MLESHVINSPESDSHEGDSPPGSAFNSLHLRVMLESHVISSPESDSHEGDFPHGSAFNSLLVVDRQPEGSLGGLNLDGVFTTAAPV